MMDESKLYIDNLTNEEKKDLSYVVFDQFHWLDPNHIEYCFKGWDVALANYNFLKVAHQDKILGLVTLEYYEKFLRKKFKHEEKRH